MGSRGTQPGKLAPSFLQQPLSSLPLKVTPVKEYDPGHPQQEPQHQGFCRIRRGAGPLQEEQVVRSGQPFFPSSVCRLRLLPLFTTLILNASFLTLTGPRPSKKSSLNTGGGSSDVGAALLLQLAGHQAQTHAAADVAGTLCQSKGPFLKEKLFTFGCIWS